MRHLTPPGVPWPKHRTDALGTLRAHTSGLRLLLHVHPDGPRLPLPLRPGPPQRPLEQLPQPLCAEPEQAPPVEARGQRESREPAALRGGDPRHHL